MTFRNERIPGEEKRVLLRRRTLQVLTGKARYDYSHGICNEDLLSDRRVSITMRESPLTKNKS
jgi:alkylated DNA repair dioxygenase AlkB